MIARKSFLERSSQRISRLSSTSRRDSLINEKEWEWSFLRKQCKLLGVETFYKIYMQRLRASYLTLLIIIELLVVAVHCIALLSTISDLNIIATDIFAYVISALLVWGILALNFKEKFIQRYSWITYVTSYSAVTILAMMDIGVTVYHAINSVALLTPFFDSYILYAVYMFMPLTSKAQVFILGMSATVLYLLCYAFVTYRNLSHGTKTIYVCKVISEGIFLLSINFLGIYFRMMRENAIRITFLDRRKYVEESLLLRYAREEEQRLLLNIIPEHVVDKIESHVKWLLKYEMTKKRYTPWRLCSRREMQMQKSSRLQAEHEKLFIEPHDNVTILYADVVNYTQLTTTLDVKTLVETLHDLFVKFDTASEEFNVLRIKFLGDCYYAVAGVSHPNEHHAKCCVELGLQMITIIRDVRTQRKLDIDMRIGIHTGSIISGVIGACKIQYDIWSKDVDIASRLEQTGIAGRLHISEETLKQLGDQYMYEQGTREAKVDPFLKSCGIQTFLIKQSMYPAYNVQKSSLATADYRIGEHFRADTTTNFMQNNTPQFIALEIQAEQEMIRQFEKMPLGRIQVPTCCINRSKSMTLDESEDEEEITSMCLFFEDWHYEMQFLIESDDMLKYNVIMGVIIFAAITAVNLINQVQSAIFWICNIIFTVLLLTFLFLTWFKKLWIMYFAETQPRNCLILFLFNASKEIQSCVIGRIAIYLSIISIHFSATFIQLLDCRKSNSLSQKNNLVIYARRADGELCFNPWGVTESLELTICMVFLFSRIPFVVKLAMGILMSATYSIVIFVSHSTIFEAGPSTTVALQAKYSHIMVVVITFVIFYLMDRQTEFISKVDYILRRKLQRKQEDAEMTNAYITMLINNILPSHVADIYISQQMQNELYYEEHDNVAVMFASIKNYDIERVGLAVLNEMICSFDEVIKHFETEGMFKVEKIKIAGWNYMAACGLDLARSNNINVQNTLPNRSQQHNETRADDKDASTSKKKKKLAINLPQGYIVYIMARFALQLMKTMHGFNVEHHQHCEDEDPSYGMLRIGISNGPVMAGVIGSSKPHYDIWGDCVNMASRMSLTGLPGRIQVTENTAEILQTFNIQCDSRGMTYVKGRGEIPTYFLGVDETFNFISETKNTNDATRDITQ